MEQLRTFTLEERPALVSHFQRLHATAWPRFLQQRDALGYNKDWPALYTTFAGFQVLLCDQADDVVAVGNTVPLVWDGLPASLPGSIAGILAGALRTRHGGAQPTALVALAAITSGHEGQGLSREILRAMRSLAEAHGLTALVAPVRPAQKARYPLTPMDRYARWTREDGAPFDPWIRVHWRLGAKILDVMAQSLVIVGAVREWEEWTGMTFPESGRYIVPGALQPVLIDRQRDEGRYEDPNVWMHHSL